MTIHGFGTELATHASAGDPPLDHTVLAVEVPEELRSAAAAVDWNALEPSGAYARGGKRLFDLAILVLVLPVAAVLALGIGTINLIRFGPRRVFSVQSRLGHRGGVFSLYKFRTMRSPGPCGRARVDAIGRVLRRTHLDELPQLWNVLLGDMHLVGPRPELIGVELWALRNVPGFLERLAVGPGITGYAQITQGYTGHDVRAYERKRDLNREYLATFGLLRDLEIALRTPLWMLGGHGDVRETSSQD
jgi:lipopolysaccharide/colanic/teichoic acid biosynthesis glycosyltransferase